MSALTRRKLLAGVATAAPVAALPVAAATASENPELFALERAFDEAEAAYRTAVERKRQARALAEQLCPTPPSELVLSPEEHALGMRGHPEVDIEGQSFYHTGKPERFILTVACLEFEARDYGPRTKIGRVVRKKLPIAKAHEAAIEEAKVRSGIREAARAEEQTRFDLEGAGTAVANAEARTVDGLRIKARTYTSFVAATGGKERYVAALKWGPVLVEAVMHVTAP